LAASLQARRAIEPCATTPERARVAWAALLLVPKSTDTAEFCLAESGSKRPWSAGDGAVGGVALGLTSYLVAGQGTGSGSQPLQQNQRRMNYVPLSDSAGLRLVADVPIPFYQSRVGRRSRRRR
jgi:hypothetical protein